VLGPVLYLIFTADLPQTNDTLIAKFAYDTAILTSDLDPRRASEKLQNHLNTINRWLHQWKICVNTTKSVQITFTTKRSRCPQVNISNNVIWVKNEVKYLGLYLDEKLTWKPHIKAKRRQLDLKIKNMYWLLNRKSKLSMETQKYWVFGLCPSSGFFWIPKKKHVSETGSVSVLRWGKTPTLLGPLERANLKSLCFFFGI
jgi:hypothetical protein